MQHHSQVVSQALRAFRYRNHSHQRSMKQFGLALRFYIVWFFRFFFFIDKSTPNCGTRYSRWSHGNGTHAASQQPTEFAWQRGERWLALRSIRSFVYSSDLVMRRALAILVHTHSQWSRRQSPTDWFLFSAHSVGQCDLATDASSPIQRFFDIRLASQSVRSLTV